MNYRLYLFDFDYTLVNSESAIVQCFHITLQKLGYEDVPDERIKNTIGLPMTEAVKRIIGTDDENEAEHFVDHYRPEADRYMTPGTTFFPGAVAALRAIKETGAKIGIISNKTHRRIQEKFDVDHVPELIDLIIGSDDVTNHKPEPTGLLRAIEHFGVKKSDVLYTGDSYIDAETAQNAGVDFLAVTTGTTSAADFAKYPHIAILKSIAELKDHLHA
ncbi:HAD family hydrolase [uncultured Mitsuokella sp.]|uniref:HAD family hydrolase n=1 Tax=uncultured Mitsuokella sp. TaxID=453120 RepID=UPI0025F84DCB|nr:HAD-IA family hydrolase [uncultured Mitsuokella sp.]